MVELPLVVTTDQPLIRNTRPTHPAWTTDPVRPWDPDIIAYLEAQGDRYRETPIIVEAGSYVSSFWDKPIVASKTMCAEATEHLDYNSPSPKFLIGDEWHNLRFTVTGVGNVVFTDANPHTITVSPLPKALKAGFVLQITKTVAGNPDVVTYAWLTLMADAAEGATSISCKRIYWDWTVDTGQVITACNGYFYQQGTPAVMLQNLCLLGDARGDPNTPGGDCLEYYENWTYWDTLRTNKYSCDGVALRSSGAVIENLLICGFPGHGLYFSHSEWSGSNTSMHMPWDAKWECQIGKVTVAGAMAGITFIAVDGQFESLIAYGCRDYGIRLKGGNIQGDTIHTWGNNLGLWMSLGNQINQIEAEYCTHGMCAIGDTCQIGAIKAWGNLRTGVLFDVYQSTVGSMHIQQGFRGGEDGNTEDNPIWDYYPTNYALVIRGYISSFICDSVFVETTNGVNGFVLGQDNNFVITAVHLRGTILGSTTNNNPGAYGLRIRQDMSGSTLDFYIYGYGGRTIDAAPTYDLYFDDYLFLDGNSLKFRGPSVNTVRWSDGTTGTFGTPNIPAILLAHNEIEFYLTDGLSINLVHLYEFNENAGSNIIDTGSLLYDGATANSPTWATGHAGYAYCLVCSGNGHKVAFTTQSGLSTLAKASVTVWVKNNVPTENTVILSQRVDDNNRFEIGVGGTGRGTSTLNDIAVALCNGGSSLGYTQSHILSDNLWHQVAIVYDGTKSTNATRLKIYIDGVEETLAFTGTIPATIADLSSVGWLIAGRNGSLPWKGSLDSLRIYQRALYANDLMRLVKRT